MSSIDSKTDSTPAIVGEEELLNLPAFTNLSLNSNITGTATSSPATAAAATAAAASSTNNAAVKKQDPATDSKTKQQQQTASATPGTQPYPPSSMTPFSPLPPHMLHPFGHHPPPPPPGPPPMGHHHMAQHMGHHHGFFPDHFGLAAAAAAAAGNAPWGIEQKFELPGSSGSGDSASNNDEFQTFAPGSHLWNSSTPPPPQPFDVNFLHTLGSEQTAAVEGSTSTDSTPATSAQSAVATAAGSSATTGAAASTAVSGSGAAAATGATTTPGTTTTPASSNLGMNHYVPHQGLGHLGMGMNMNMGMNIGMGMGLGMSGNAPGGGAGGVGGFMPPHVHQQQSVHQQGHHPHFSNNGINGGVNGLNNSGNGSGNGNGNGNGAGFGFGGYENRRRYNNNGSGKGNGHHGRRYGRQNNNNYNNNGSRGGRSKFEDSSIFDNLTIADFQGEILTLCKDQHGCRFLQKQIDASPSNADIIFGEISPALTELMSDPFGNYLIQKLLSHLSNDNRMQFIESTYQEYSNVALSPHGTRSLQRLIEMVRFEQEFDLIKQSLKGHILMLSQDLNGNHVIQKCLIHFKSNSASSATDAAADSVATKFFSLDFIISEVAENAIVLSKHRHGCCVLQRCLDNGTLEQCVKLSSIITGSDLDALITDPFGNYVLQYILAKNFTESNLKILTFVKGNFERLATHKFGSNVIEKILKLSKLFSSELIEDILDSHVECFLTLINDPFGNYVLQTCLDSADEGQFKRFATVLRPLIHNNANLRNSVHGRRIGIRLQQGQTAAPVAAEE